MGIIINPRQIEDKSFKIISQLLPDLKLPRAQKQVLMRVIHATTDLDYVKDLLFHPRAVRAGLEAIKNAKNIICDVSMVEAGINKKALAEFGGRVICLINDKTVIKRAAKLKIARAIAAMRKAEHSMKGTVIAIGNAPTALFEVCDLVKKGKVKPALIIGVPVGFVGAKESKKALRVLRIPYITNKSRKGGSSVAAACVNALLILAKEKSVK